MSYSAWVLNGCKRPKMLDIFNYIKDDNYNGVEYYIDVYNTMSVDIIRNENDLTPLMYAAELNRYDMVELFIVKQVDLNITNNENRTALHLATLAGNEDIVNLLIDYNADINIEDTTKNTVLHYATKLGHYEIVEDLCECEDIKLDCVNQDNLTALDIANQENFKDIYKVLMRSGAKLT